MSESPPSATPANAAGHDPLPAPFKEPLEDRIQGRRAAPFDDPASGCPPIPVAKGVVRTHLAILTLAAFVYCFLCYCILRALLADFGLSAGTVLKAAIATAAMGGFIVWLVPLAELPEIVFGHVLPQRRARRGRCPACNYDLQGRRGVRCPECGHDGSIPGTWHLSWGTARRFLLVLAAGLGLGVLAGEAWTTADERAFVAEAGSLQDRIDSRIAALGPFEERLVVVDRSRDRRHDAEMFPSPGFAWIGRGDERPQPSDRRRDESATFGNGVTTTGGGGREQAEERSFVWAWDDLGISSSLACHLDLRHLPADGAFVLSIGAYRIRGDVVAAPPETRDAGDSPFDAVGADDVVVRRTNPSATTPFEVVVRTFAAEWQRPRAWPASFASMRYTPEHGIEVIDPFHSPRVVDWSPRRNRASGRIDR